MTLNQFVEQKEFEQNYSEHEQKFTTPTPEILAPLLEGPVESIHQVYLSSPTDEYSLRLRRSEVENAPTYTATLKTRGEVHDGTLERIEIETEVSEATFLHYCESHSHPELYKQRYSPAEGVTIDFIEGYTTPVVELEDIGQETELRDTLRSSLVAAPHLTNEQLAYELCEKAIERAPEFDIAMVVDELRAHYELGKTHVVLTLSGMSGSGKSTYTRQIAERIHEIYPELPSPIVLSTDDYHVGKQFLESRYASPWINWEDGRVYDTNQLAHDVLTLKNNQSIHARTFDFQTEEPVIDSYVEPSPFILVEGIHAGSADLQNVRDVFVEVPTRPATAIGRDVMRLVGRSNASFSRPEDRLRYDLEIALPTYQTFEQPNRMSTFSGSVRKLSKVALNHTDY